jgi:hypothetical protein
MSACLPLSGGAFDYSPNTEHCPPHFISFYQSKMQITSMPDDHCQENGICFYIALAMCILGAHKDYDAFSQLVDQLGTPAGLDVKVEDVDKVENDSQWGSYSLGINIVYKDEDGDIIPIRATKKTNAIRTVVLLLFHCQNAQGEQRMHYAYVGEPLRLIRHKGNIRKDTSNRQFYQKFPCYNCMNTFWSPEALTNHQTFCMTQGTMMVQMPKEHEKLTFDSSRLSDEGKSMEERTFKSAYLCFFDVETYIQKVDKPCSCSEDILENTRKIREEEEAWSNMSIDEKIDFIIQSQMEETLEDASYAEEALNTLALGKLFETHGPCTIVNHKTKKIKRPKRKSTIPVCPHKQKKLFEERPYMLSYIVCDRDANIVEEETIIGEDCGDRFLEQLVTIADEMIPPSVSPGIPYQISSTDRQLLLKTKDCHICGRVMANCVKVIDHDHLTGNVIGVAHNECNLKRRERKHLTVFCHNMSGFDSHFLIQTLTREPPCVRQTDGLPSNKQKFKTLTINNNIKFLDSLAFLQTSLDGLVGQLRASGCQFKLLDDMVQNDEEKKMLTRKGVFPYDAATSIEKLYTTTSCPSKKEFYNQLQETHIDDDDYNHALQVWEMFKPKNLMEYAVIYCKSDVRLLAEAVFDMREKIWRDFNLDICAYLSLPMLSKDMWLKHSGACLDLLYDQETAFLCMNNIRGGLSFVTQRSAGEGSLHEEAENKLKKGHMFYLDANNLYGFAMSKLLPHSDFRWMTPAEVAAFDPKRDILMDGNQEQGYILEVDLEYPEELHYAHNSFPLAPEKLNITEDILSPYSRACYDAIYRVRETDSYEQEKLTATFNDRTNYLVHGFNLVFYMKMGLKLKKIHRILTFKQAASIADYVAFCTKKRKEAKTESEKAYWKVRKKH